MPLEEIFPGGFPGAVKRVQDVLEALCVQPADDATGMGNGNRSGLFGDDNGDRIGDFGYAHGGAMAQTHLLLGGMGKDAACRKRHDTGSRNDLLAGDDDRPIMQGCVGIKDLQQQFGGHIRLDQHAAADVIIQPVEPFQDDERAVLAGRQAGGGCYDSLDGLLHPFAIVLVRDPEKGACPPDPFEGAPDLGRKDDRDGKYHGWQRRPHQPGESRQAYQAGQHGNQQQDEDDAAQQDHGLRITDQVQDAKEDHRNQQDIDDTQPVETLKNEEDIAKEFSHGFD